jgi:putative membrane protein
LKRVWTGLWMGALTLLTTAAMAAQIAPAGGSSVAHPRTLLDQALSMVVFSVLGIILAIAGFKIFDLAIRFDIEREICEKNNIAAAILAGAVVLGICMIVAVVVIS